MLLAAQRGVLGHVGVLVRAVGGPLNVLLVNQHLDALLDDGDGGRETSLHTKYKKCIKNKNSSETV